MAETGLLRDIRPPEILLNISREVMSLVDAAIPTKCKIPILVVHRKTGARYRPICGHPECGPECAEVFRRRVVAKANGLDSSRHIYWLNPTIPRPLCGNQQCLTHNCLLCSKELTRRSRMARQVLQRKGYSQKSPRSVNVQQYGERHGRLHGHQLVEFDHAVGRRAIRKAYSRHGLKFKGERAIQPLEGAVDKRSAASYAARYAARPSCSSVRWPKGARRLSSSPGLIMKQLELWNEEKARAPGCVCLHPVDCICGALAVYRAVRARYSELPALIEERPFAVCKFSDVYGTDVADGLEWSNFFVARTTEAPRSVANALFLKSVTYSDEEKVA
jgi:hypothetical protein